MIWKPYGPGGRSRMAPRRLSGVTKKLALRFRKGRTEKDLEVPPGEHVVRVEVSGDGFHDSRRIRGSFESGVTRRLQARVGGLLNRELSLVWGS